MPNSPMNLFDKMLKTLDKRNVYVNNDVHIKPDYLNHDYISGNKFRKLKYNILEAKQLGKNQILTFGGAFSNHIAAVAAMGREFNFHAIGVIRGEELAHKEITSPTLKFAQECGMVLKYVTREDYRLKSSKKFIEHLKREFGKFYLIPEGGTNQLAIKGCEEILTTDDEQFDYICCSVGTGGTIAGIINSSLVHQKILGFPSLKGDFLREDIAKFANHSNWDLITDYHFGGYAKINMDLISFINQFKKDHNIPLDPVYTGKMLFGIYDLKRKGYFPKGSKILAIHTGGLQGIEGMNMNLKQKGLPLIM